MDPLVFRLRLLELAAEYDRLHAAQDAPKTEHSRESLLVAPDVPKTEPLKTALRQSSSSDGPAKTASGRERPGRVLVLDPTFASEATCASDDGEQAAHHQQLEERPSDESAKQPGKGAKRRTGSMRSDTCTEAASNPYGSEISAGSAGETVARRQKRTVTWESLGYKSSGRGSGRHSSVIEGSAETDGTLATMATARGQAHFDRAVKKTLSKLSLGVGDGGSRDSAQSRAGKPLAWIVQSRAFTVAFASLIIMSALLIGIETQLLSSLSYQRAGSEQMLAGLSATNYVLTFLFTVEMAARLYVFRSDFFVQERVWNCFDLVILALALVEVTLELGMYAISGKQRGTELEGGTARLLRLFRLTRLLRLVRSFRQLKPLRMLMHSIMFAGKSVFWALMLLFMIIFSFGVILTQAATEHTEGGERVDDEELIAYFGDLNRSMVHLWMAVSGGINWIELTRPLVRTGNTVWLLLFVLYITFVSFFILNVVTGVFCQNAIEGAQKDLDLSIDAHLSEKQVYVDRLKMLFQEMNEDPDATGDELTAAQLHFQLAKPKVQSWFKSLDIDANETWRLFKILDTAHSGLVSVEEFVEGCLRLRGSATRVDVASLKWEIRGAKRGAEKRAEQTAKKLEEVVEGLGSLRAAVGLQR